MELRFQEEIGTWEKLGFLNPYDLTEEEVSKLPVRYGTRTIILTPENKIVLLNIRNEHIHTLVGGNIDEGESIEEGMIRECKEESGYDVSHITPLGYIELWRKNYRRFVFGFLVRANGEAGPLSLTEAEKEKGSEVMVCTIDEAIDTINTDVDESDSLASIRSMMFLEEAKKHIKSLINN